MYVAEQHGQERLARSRARLFVTCCSATTLRFRIHTMADSKYAGGDAADVSRQLQTLSQNVDVFNRNMSKQIASHEAKAADAALESKVADLALDDAGAGSGSGSGVHKGEDKESDARGDIDASKELYVMKNNISALLAGMRAEVERENAAAEPKAD